MAYIPPLDLSNDSCKQENKTLTTFSERFKYALNLRHLSVSFVRRMLGVSETKMLKYLNGDFKPGKKELEQIARVLDVNESWLTGQDVPMTKYDGTPEAFDMANLSDDKSRRSKIVDILYKQMESLSKADKYTSDVLIDLINLSVAMAEIAKAIFFLEQ